MLFRSALYLAMKKETFHASVLEMELAGKVEKVLLRDFQMHPYKQLVLHVDFQRIDAKTRVVKKIPLHFKGEENSPAVKTDKCLVNHVATEIEVECLAASLPEFIEVDLSAAVKGQSIHAKDLVLPKGVKLVTHGKPNAVISSVVEPVEEVIEAAPVAAAAPAKDKKGKK